MTVLHLGPRSIAVTLLVLAVSAPLCRAQQPPDSGTTQQQPEPQIRQLPQTGAPTIDTRKFRRAFIGANVNVMPSAFTFSGNTLISDSELRECIKGWLGKLTDINGLGDAAAKLRELYAARGYVLTDVYFPEQSFSAAGGTVEFAVVEARVGKVTVTVADGSGVSEAYATSLANTYLARGELISQEMLDKPVLLLRDMVRTDAAALVGPGDEPGEANISISVTPRGPRFRPTLAVDNMGVISGGAYRASAGAAVEAPFTLGDELSMRTQWANREGNKLFGVNYGLALGRFGSKVGASFTRSDYALGRQFATLKAFGQASVASLSVLHPLVRSRFTNLFVSASIDNKDLQDDIRQFRSSTDKHIALARFSVLGNHSDRALAGGTTSFALAGSAGRLHLDIESARNDRSSGTNANGGFYKLNAELQRVQYLKIDSQQAWLRDFMNRSSILIGFNGQYASKNLTSAEKMNLGGPQGVRGYPIGEGVGDVGALFLLEYRYLMPLPVFGQPLTIKAFYDHGWVRRDRDPPAAQRVQSSLENSITLNSAGIGTLVGREGSFVLTAELAARLGGSKPTTGDPDSAARLIMMMQYWF